MKPSERFEPKSDAEMSGDVVVQLLRLFDQHGIEVVVDGGWGVDALLGEQTRLHGDLDIALEHKDVPKLRALLEARGYRDVPRDDTRDCNFVMGDKQGHEVDFHSYTFDAHGKLIFGVEYPFDSLLKSFAQGICRDYAAVGAARARHALAASSPARPRLNPYSTGSSPLRGAAWR